MSTLLLIFFVTIPYYLICSADQKIFDEKSANSFLQDVNKRLGEKIYIKYETEWNFNTDINTLNEKKVVSLLLMFRFSN